MIERLFLGGPMHGRWVATDPKYATWLVDSPVPRPNPRDAIIYTRRRYRHPSWRIVLTFFVTSDYVPASGDVMPGDVLGERLDFSPLCHWCRARPAPYPDLVCLSCLFGEPQGQHIWVDGVGNELGTCARCGARE